VLKSFNGLIYLDYNATTPCSAEVVAAMLPYFSEKFGNPASRTHAKGWQADEAVKQATAHLAQMIHATPAEIIYTSGATESCNLAIKGVYERLKAYGNHIITCSTEHKAVLDTCAHLEQLGATVSYLDVDSNGNIALSDLEAAITEQTILIALMYANNETGVIHPVAEIGKIARERKIYFFCDATQAAGKLSIDVQRDHIDLLALSAHKFYGPKGVGALYINRKVPRVQLVAQIDGGGHQNGFRSGTLNVPGIVGIGKAAMLCKTEQHAEEMARIGAWRDEIEAGLLMIPGALINSAGARRLPNVINIAFPGIKAERLVSKLNDVIAFSVGSACTSAQQKASHVLQAMRIDKEVLDGSVRLSLGKLLSAEDIPIIMQQFKQAVTALQQ